MKTSHFAPFALATGSLTFVAAFLPCAHAQQRFSLPDTVVTATRFPEEAQPLPIGVSLVTADEIRASGASTIDEALMRILGVAGRADLNGGGAYNLDLRGFGAASDNNQVVIVDGVRYSEADLGGTRLAGIPIESVERIEVLRGSGAVLWGEGATGGVIVVTTKAGADRDRRNTAAVSAAVGTYKLRDLRANATLAGGGFSLDASGEKRDSDNHRDNFRSKLDAASVTGQWAGERGRIGARYGRDTMDTGLPGGLSQAQYDANPRQSFTPGDHGRITGERASLFGDVQLGSWQVAGEAAHRTKQLRSTTSGFAYDYDIAASNESLRARHHAKLAGGANTLVVGTDHASWKRDVLGSFGSISNESSRAWYLKDDYTFASGTRVSAGWRTEGIAKDNSTAFASVDNRQRAWELGASHPFTSAFTAYARAGRSFRLPNVDEFAYTGPAAALRPQVSRDLELGGRWTYASGKAEVRLYRSLLTDEIGYDPNSMGPYLFPGANVNFDPTRREGIELDTRHQLTRTLALRVNGAVRRADFRSGPYTGRDVPLVPRQTLAVRGDWTPGAGHRVTGGINWVSSQHPDFDNRCTMPAYTVADARYAYQWRNVELSLAVSNLTDRRFYTQAFTCAAGVTGAMVTGAIYPEAGRAFTGTVRVGF